MLQSKRTLEGLEGLEGLLGPFGLQQAPNCLEKILKGPEGLPVSLRVAQELQWAHEKPPKDQRVLHPRAWLQTGPKNPPMIQKNILEPKKCYKYTLQALKVLHIDIPKYSIMIYLNIV